MALLPLLFLLAVAPESARAWVMYDAALGTPPEAQGWTLNEDIGTPHPYSTGVAAGELHLSTLEFGVNFPPDNGGGVWWSRSGVALNFSSPFAVEASVRIGSSINHTMNPDTGWPRPGFALVVFDALGRIFWVGFGSGEVFLSNTSYGNYGAGNTVFTAFNTTDVQHVYRIERAPGGVGAALRIDGELKLVLPALGGVEAPAGGLVYFGDPTYWANSESYTAWVRYTDGVLAVESPTGSHGLWAAAMGSPAARLGIAYRCAEQGTLELEIFDAAGRRVGREERAVVAGESGHFEAAGAHGAGLYFYRARLSPDAGTASEATGRIVFVR